MKRSGLNIYGVGFTVYLGGENENAMLEQASRVCWKAHQEGLVAVLWVKTLSKEKSKVDASASELASQAGVGVSLGYDFVHVSNYPEKENNIVPELLFQEVVISAELRAGYLLEAASWRMSGYSSTGSIDR